MKNAQGKCVVPMAALAPIVREWAKDNRYTLEAGWNNDSSNDGTQAGGIQILAFRSGVSTRKITAILTGRFGGAKSFSNVDFDTADKLLCGMQLVSEWQSRLAEFYGPIEVRKHEYEREMPLTESDCGTLDSYTEGCRCKRCFSADHKRYRAA